MRRWLLVPALVGIAVVYAAFDQGSGIPVWWRLRGQLAASEARIGDARLEVERLRREAEELESDPFALERAIREDLELARPGEALVRARPARGSNPRFP